MKNHNHCWEQKQPPACGKEGRHGWCCICTESNATSKDSWREELRELYKGEWSAPTTNKIEAFIERTRKDAAREALEELEKELPEDILERRTTNKTQKYPKVIDLIRKHKETL